MTESQYPYHEHGSTQRKGMSALSAFVVTLAILIVAGTLGYFGYQKFWPDSGVAMCEEMAKDKQVGGDKNNPNDKLTEAEYKKIREAFADSRDEEIKRHGTALIDAFWQVANLKEGEEMGALTFVGSITSSYAGLTGACAEHGHTLPPMSDLNSDASN